MPLVTGVQTCALPILESSKLARTRLAKSVLGAGWSGFKRMLSYKALMHGGRYLEVSERMSTQTCSECGTLPPSRPKGIAGLGIREWECSDCGAVHDRDVRSEEHTSDLQSLMRISYAYCCSKKKIANSLVA